MRATTAEATTMARPSAGSSATARTGARQSPSSTPASIALASGGGMAATARPSGFHSPATTISAPVTMKAPTAAGKPPGTAPVVANSAAPGVDQAMLIGILVLRLSAMAQTPIEIDSAISPDAASAWLAPTPRSPAMITAKEEAKPTNAASTPAASAGSEKD